MHFIALQKSTYTRILFAMGSYKREKKIANPKKKKKKKAKNERERLRFKGNLCNTSITVLDVLRTNKFKSS